MVTLARRAHRIPFAPVVALLFGIVSAILVAAVPQWMFEAAVVASGLPTVLAAASPPLGLLARLLAIALAFGAGTMVVWALVAPAANYLEAKARARTPWRDAGYDSEAASMRSEMLPPRRPIFAPDELGAPLMSDEAISPPSAIPDVTPAVSADVRPATAVPFMHAPESIPELIRRLEDGLARRMSSGGEPDGSGRRPAGSVNEATAPDDLRSRQTALPDDNVLDETLRSLRQLATR